jgi:hypothetical protein
MSERRRRHDDIRRRRPFHGLIPHALIPHALIFVFAYLCLVGWNGVHAVEARGIMAQAESERMRVEFATSGGIAYFPGLARPVVIEADQLPEADARRLDDLVAASRFFDQPAQVEGRLRSGAADYRQYTITIDQGTQRHTLTITEPIEDPDLRQLVSFLEAQAKASRQKARDTQRKE